MVIEKLGSLGYAGDQVLEKLSIVGDGIIEFYRGIGLAIARMNRLL